MRLTNDDGSATVELAILAPALLLALCVVIMGGRIMTASNAAESVSGSSARAASLARTPREATAAAQRVASADLARQGLKCAGGGPRVSTDTSNWSGRPASVAVQVTCEVALSDIGMPGLPGSRMITATATSPVDSWRGQ